MRFSLDRAGFPLVAMEELNLEMTLLPVSKQQMEFFLTDPEEVFEDQSLGSKWYEELLEVGPRVCAATFPAALRERLFVTGIRRGETERFGKWLGGFRLPTGAEWRQMEACLRGERSSMAQLEEAMAGARKDVAAIFVRLRRQLQSDQIADLTLMVGGLVEWLRDPDGEFGLGQPRDAFHKNVFNPRERPKERWVLNSNERLRFAGFRLVRPIKAVLEEEE